MKKFMIASLGLSLLSGTAMFAQDKDTAGSTESSTMKKKSKKKKKDTGASGATTSTTATSK